MTWLDVPIGMTWMSKNKVLFIRIGFAEGVNFGRSFRLQKLDQIGKVNFDRFCGYLPPELV